MKNAPCWLLLFSTSCSCLILGPAVASRLFPSHRSSLGAQENLARQRVHSVSLPAGSRGADWSEKQPSAYKASRNTEASVACGCKWSLS
jgi:hypothetical protein